MREDVIFYDCQGFVPSMEVKSLDDYLRESEHKHKALEKLASNPAEFLSKDIGCKIRMESASEKDAEDFYNVFMTRPMPALVARDQEFFRTVKIHREMGWIDRYLKVLGINGTIVRPRVNGCKLTVPIVRDSPDISDRSRTICHESVHAIIDSRDSLRRKMRYGINDEAMAYVWNVPDSAKPMSMLLINVIYQGMFLAPLAIAAGLSATFVAGFDPILSFAAAFGVSGSYAYHGKQAYGFIRKCHEEHLNPYYLLLRSDPSEYKSKILETLAKEPGPRFEVMRHRLKLGRFNS
jgi:hypothetical protein